MYAGHAAIALVLKTRAPHAPLLALALASYGPDWLEVALMIPKPREGMAPFTHSLPSIVLGGLLFAGAYSVLTRRPGAPSVLVAWLLHWPCDFLTGRKPVFGLDTIVGLDLYHLAPADFILEAIIVAIGCGIYARAFAHSSAQRRTVVALAAALIVLQLAVNLGIAALDQTPWSPVLAGARWMS